MGGIEPTTCASNRLRRLTGSVFLSRSKGLIKSINYFKRHGISNTAQAEASNSDKVLNSTVLLIFKTKLKSKYPIYNIQITL